MKLSGGAFGLTSEEHVLSSVDKRDVGRKMLTKMLGSFLDEDLVGRYKAPDGHALERASLLRNEAAAASALKPRGSLELSVQVIPPIGAEGLSRRPPAGACRLFLGPGFRLAARWNRLVE
eukprot:COSAG04_NODE_277_length_18399_cov_3.036066_1_plen_119_part_10